MKKANTIQEHQGPLSLRHQVPSVSLNIAHAQTLNKCLLNVEMNQKKLVSTPEEPTQLKFIKLSAFSEEQ